MPFNSELSIICGATSGESAFAIALSDLDLDSPSSIILTYRASVEQPWSRYDFEDVVRAMTTSPPDLGNAYDYVAVTDEGAVLYFNGSMLQESIPGAGVWSDDADGSGAMSAVGRAGDRFLATGDAGQVFERRGPDRWAPAFPKPPEGISGDFRTFAPLRGNSLLFGGPASAALEVTPEMEAAEQNGDFEAYQRLVMAQNAGHGALWVYDGAWLSIDPPTNATPVEMFSTPDLGTLVAFDAGLVLRTNDASVFEYSDAIDTKAHGDVVSIISHENRILVATELALFWLDFPSFSDFSPKPPYTVAGIVTVRSAGSTLWIFDDRAVYRLSAGAWEEIDVPRKLLATPFTGI